MRIRKKIISILMLSFFTTLTYSLILPTIVKADINNYTPLKFAVIIAGGFDYYMNIYMGNSIQKLDNLIHGRGVPYDILRDSLIVGPSDNPPEGRYSLQYSNGTIKYQTIVLQANRYSVKTVANRQHILSAVGNGTNLMVFGTVIAGIPEVFGLSSSEIETVNWPSSVTQTISVTKTFNDSIKSYSQGTVLTAGPASRLETRVRNSTNKTVWFNISWSNYWSIGMMNTTYGSGSAWWLVWDFTETADFSGTLQSWASSNFNFWAHAINFALNNVEKLPVKILPYKRWSGAWILRLDRDYMIWLDSPPQEVLDAGWKWMEGYPVLGSGRSGFQNLALTSGAPSGYSNVPQTAVRYTTLSGVLQTTLNTYRSYMLILYSETVNGTYNRIKIDFNENRDFSDDLSYSMWENITYPSILGTLYWSYIEPNFDSPTYINVGWFQTPILFYNEEEDLPRLRDAGRNYGEVYGFHGIHHTRTGHSMADGTFMQWNGTAFIENRTYVREMLELSRQEMIRQFGESGNGFEADRVVMHFPFNIHQPFVDDALSELPWIQYELVEMGWPSFFKASPTWKWWIYCSEERYDRNWETYEEAMLTIYPYLCAFQHVYHYNLSLNNDRMLPYVGRIKIANANDAFEFFISSRDMLKNVSNAFFNDGKITLEFIASQDLEEFVWKVPREINGQSFTNFTDSRNISHLAYWDDTTVFIEFQQGQGEQRIEIQYGEPVPQPPQPSPHYSYNFDDSSGSVVNGTIVNISVLWNDDIALSTALFRSNETGLWLNTSSCSLSGTSQWCNRTIDTTGQQGKTICWNQWADNSRNNLNNAMPIHCFSVTIQDTDPPSSVMNLNETSVGSTWIYWSWNNPTDPDFNRVMIYIDGIFITNTSSTTYNATGFSPNTTHQIATHTVDNAGNVNYTWVNDTAVTFIPMIASNSFGKTSVGSYFMGYSNRIFGTNFTVSSNGVATSITGFITTYGNTRSVKGAIYNANTGALVGYTEERSIAVPAAGAWTTFNITNGGTLVAGTSYYLVIWSSGAVYLSTSWVTNAGGYDAETYDGFPDPWSRTLSSGQHSIYANYTIDGTVYRI